MTDRSNNPGPGAPEPLRTAGGLARRRFLEMCGFGLGGLLLDGALPGAQRLSQSGLQRPRGFGKAKKVLYLHMSGGPSGLDLFDYKPKLSELDGTPCPKEFVEGKQLAFIKGRPNLLGTPRKFQQVGQNGSWVSDLMPHFGEIVDDVCMVHSMHTDQFNHAPAELLLHTGSPFFGGASFGSWALYGLGSLNRDLPGFVVMLSGPSDPTGGKSLWGSGFLPSHLQGTLMRGQGEPILYVDNPDGMDRKTRRRTLDALAELNQLELERTGAPETVSRLEQYELAFRMQATVPEAMDLAAESPEMIAAYGAEPGKKSFANNCLYARRLLERDVRFVQLYDWGWDHHGTNPGDDLTTSLPQKCKETDQPIKALMKDLAERGLLDDTLVVWGGEFGRTPMFEGRNGSTNLGRDHHPGCFTMWLSGAGIKTGQHYGQTDDLGYAITENPVSVRDLQATILHLLGLDPFQLRYPYLGLEQRLIGPDDDAARIVTDLLA